MADDNIGRVLQGNAILRDPAGLIYERFSDGKVLRMRTRHVADSVVDRILEVSSSLKAGDTPPLPTTTAIDIANGENGELLVTKVLSDGTQESMTISSDRDKDRPYREPRHYELEPTTGPAPAGAEEIVSNAAMGGNALDAILKGD